MNDRWLGNLEIGQFAATWRGAVGESEAHSHFAGQAVIAATPVVVETEIGPVAAQCVLIEPGARHRLLPHPDAELHFVEPTLHWQGAQLAEIITGFPYKIVDAGNAAPSFWTGWLKGEITPTNDPRLEGAMKLLDSTLAEGPVRLAPLAASTGLSPDRFRHLFAAQIGIPLRRYVLWRRMALAARGLAKGRTITAAAHEAGFADAAHFARTIKRMFGINARQLRPV